MQYAYKYVCPYCAQATEIVMVHGMSTCEHCHMSLDDGFAGDQLML